MDKRTRSHLNTRETKLVNSNNYGYNTRFIVCYSPIVCNALQIYSFNVPFEISTISMITEKILYKEGEIQYVLNLYELNIRNQNEKGIMYKTNKYKYILYKLLHKSNQFTNKAQQQLALPQVFSIQQLMSRMYTFSQTHDS